MANVEYLKPYVSNQLLYWEVMEDISNGWRGIVGKGETYLKKEPSETQDNYTYRLDKALFQDMFNPTVDGLTGLIFKKPIVYNDDIPSQLIPLIENADNTGNHLDILLEQMFKTAIEKGISFAYIDMPKADGANTKADEQQRGIRPYVVLYEPENVTSWKTININGELVLDQVKLLEAVEEDDEQNPYATETVKQYRILERGSYKVIRVDKSGAESVYDEGVTGLNYIPLVALNIDPRGFFMANTPFYDLAKLNIRHYQISTDSAHSAHTASVPFYFGSGIDAEEAKGLKISPNTFFATHNPDADIKIVDYDGKGVEVNEVLLKRIESKIMQMGLAVVTEDKEQTATEVGLATTQKQSKLNKWVRLLTDAAELILQMMARYYGRTEGGSITIDADILSKPLTAQELMAINNMVLNNTLSVETAWAMIGAGSLMLPDGWDSEVEKERVSQDGLLGDNK